MMKCSEKRCVSLGFSHSVVFKWLISLYFDCGFKNIDVDADTYPSSAMILGLDIR